MGRTCVSHGVCGQFLHGLWAESAGAGVIHGVCGQDLVLIQELLG